MYLYYFLFKVCPLGLCYVNPFDLIARPRLGNLLCFGNDITFTNYSHQLFFTVSFLIQSNLSENGHQSDRTKCLLYRGVRVHKERLDCMTKCVCLTFFNGLRNLILTLNVYRYLFQILYFLSRFGFCKYTEEARRPKRLY